MRTLGICNPLLSHAVRFALLLPLLPHAAPPVHSYLAYAGSFLALLAAVFHAAARFHFSGLAFRFRLRLPQAPLSPLTRGPKGR